MQNTIYITGHKNPDTDSICAAIAYSEYKKKKGLDTIPLRLGEVNRETQFVLKYFGVDVPSIMMDVKTQVSDLEFDVVSPVSPDISIKTAWSIMKKNNVKVLPVADEEERLIGIVTLSDITKNYLDTMENSILSISRTPLDTIIETLDAKLICGRESDFNTTGKVVIAAMTCDCMDPFVEKGDIVITGNREDSQIKSIELGAACLIVTCGGQVEKEVISLAERNKCIIITTQHDTFNTSRLINQSVPVGFIMTHQDLVYFDIGDYVEDIQAKMLKTRYRSYPVVDEHYKIKGFVSRYHLISQRRKKVILLDHNEKSQTIDGIEQAEILEIIDHHRIGDIQTMNPVYFKNEPVGSTSTIIANQYFEDGIKPSRKIAGIMCAAIISDTMYFKSPTCTRMDMEIAQKLSKIADIDMEAFALMMFKAGSALEGKSSKDILYNDFKDYHFGEHKIGIGQINSIDRDSIEKYRKDLIDYMEEVCDSKNYSVMLLLLTDIFKEGSELIFAGKNKWIISKAFKVEVDGGSTFVKGLVSRKKQVVPNIASAIQMNS
ncbi:MAG: putative manganese-dependent inorganic diphosphatase [Clostridia bacterium]|nr:putative manganese-dependent inorganic diphosphatase [Clostridia bacterium]